MKKNYLFIGAAAIIMAGCASDDLVGDENISSGETPIAFSMNTPNATRDAHSDAATALGNEFIVWGEKNEPNTGAACGSTDLVFENYRVQYKDGTANTTASNTKDWEYVGIAPYSSGVESKISAATQTIKYWDLGKKYTFTAVSAKQQDITDGKVTITKIAATTKQSGGSPQDKGYKIVLTNGADATKIFVADRQEVTAPTFTEIANASKSITPVTMAFRNFQTKIRFGFYETVPGYNVQITGIKYTGDANETAVKTLSIKGEFVTSPTGTNKLTYTVTYKDNKPVVEIDKSASTATTPNKTFGTYIFTDNLNLGTQSSNPTYDQDAAGSYSSILPNTGNETPMTFKVSYKLISEDTKEVIEVTDRQVTVPAVYCQWKPNFAYTYLFKVSDTSAELYPITFDAVVENDEVDKQETITEVGEPSITTYAWDSSNKKVITGKDEYETGNVIYSATNIAAGMTSSNTVLYTVTATTDGQVQNAVAPKITEASVANCVANMTPNADSHVAKDATGGILTVTKFNTSDANFVANTVPTEDGNGTRTINALTWTDSNTNEGTYYYAVEYTYNNKKYYKIVKVVKPASSGS